ncbi:MAG: hypothetical protein WD045_01900 [Pirellulaceae bacterium]
MTFDEFEAQVQQLIDEDRFAEARALLALVRSEDFERSSQLLAGYESMLIGLAAWQAPDMPGRFVEHVVDKVRSTTRHEDAVGTGRGWGTWLPYLSMALAASMAAVMVSPAILYDREVAPIAWRQLLSGPVTAVDERVSAPEPTQVKEPMPTIANVEPTVSVVLHETMDSKDRFAHGSPLDELAMSWSASDSQLFGGTYYVETAPLIESVSRGLRPLTETMGSAINIIKDSTIPGSQPLSPAGTPQASRPGDHPSQHQQSFPA